MNYKEYTARVSTDGKIEWFKVGTTIYHREDGPAIIEPKGSEVWYFEGKIHRDGGPANKDMDGREWWFQHGKLHRVDGPAAIYPKGSTYWYQNDQRHNENGPAIIHANGEQEWYLCGIQFTESDWLKKVRKPEAVTSCDGKIVEIEGKKYKLTECKE